MALVGRSGSGKSTIASLITRFYDVDDGQILLDGHDLREYTLSSLRDQVALVSQNVHLFNDTVANNIAYARTERVQPRADRRSRSYGLCHGLYQQNGQWPGYDYRGKRRYAFRRSAPAYRYRSRPAA